MEVICLIYGVPSLLLSIFFLKFLSRNEFKYSFYRLLQCDILLNILCYSNAWFVRFCNWSVTVPMMLVVYENFYVAFQVSVYLVNFFFNAQAMSVIFLSVHRLTSSRFVMANGFWSKYYLPVYLMILLLSALPSFYVISIDALHPSTYNYTSEVFVASPIDPKKREILLKIFFYLSLFFFSAILLVNASTLYVIHQRFKKISDKTQKLMKNLTLIAIINSTIFFVVFLWQLFGLDALGVKFWVDSMNILSDALSLLLPYILLAFDRNVRSTLAQMIGSRAISFAKYLGYSVTSQRTASVVNVI